MVTKYLYFQISWGNVHAQANCHHFNRTVYRHFALANKSQLNLQLRKQKTTSCVLTSWKQFSRELFKMDVWYSSFFYFSMTMLFILVDSQWLKSIIEVNKFESGKTVKTGCCANGGVHLIVTIAGDLDARLPHFHVHHQTFHHRQRVLVVTEVLRQNNAKGGRRRELFEPQRQERQISGVVTTLSDKINELQSGTEQKEESQKAFPLACRFYANTSHRENSYCQQIHDGVTGLSKQGFSEADAEQRTWVDCKRKKMLIHWWFNRNTFSCFCSTQQQMALDFRREHFYSFITKHFLLLSSPLRNANELQNRRPCNPPHPCQHTHKA